MLTLLEQLIYNLIICSQDLVSCNIEHSVEYTKRESIFEQAYVVTLAFCWIMRNAEIRCITRKDSQGKGPSANQIRMPVCHPQD